MIFEKIRHNKRDSRHVRIRMKSCVDTVLEINEILGDGRIKPEVIKQFESLDESILLATDETVEEQDVCKIEEATNQLMAEIRAMYGDRDICFIHEGPKH